MEFQFFGKFKIAEGTECAIKTQKNPNISQIGKSRKKTECPIKIPMYQKPNIPQIFLELLPESFTKNSPTVNLDGQRSAFLQKSNVFKSNCYAL